MLDTQRINPFHIDCEKLYKLNNFKCVETKVVFLEAFKIYKQILLGELEFNEGFQILFKLRHQYLMAVNEYLASEDDECDDLSEYNKISEAYIAVDSLFIRLIGISNRRNGGQIGDWINSQRRPEYR